MPHSVKIFKNCAGNQFTPDRRYKKINLLHLKYAVVISETNSMTKAAEKLYTAQPNLSRAVRELETSLGITLFKRTPKGIYPTPEGEEFLGYARNILSQVDEIEALYHGNGKKKTGFSISVPRASYISCAFTEFIKEINPDNGSEIFYMETNSLRAINNIIDSDYKLGILRYQSAYESNFDEMLDEKGLTGELIFEFNYRLIMSENHPLASREIIRINDLTPYTEIAHADPYVPSMPMSAVRKEELSDNIDNHVYVFERGSQLDLLSESVNTFMWASPIPRRLLDRFALVQRECPDNKKLYRDVLIRKKDYILTDTDKQFIDTLVSVKRSLAQ